MTGHGLFVYLLVQFRLQCSFVMTTTWEEPEVRLLQASKYSCKYHCTLKARTKQLGSVSILWFSLDLNALFLSLN